MLTSILVCMMITFSEVKKKFDDVKILLNREVSIIYDAEMDRINVFFV